MWSLGHQHHKRLGLSINHALTSCEIILGGSLATLIPSKRNVCSVWMGCLYIPTDRILGIST